MSNSDYFLINNLQYFPESKKIQIAETINNLDSNFKLIIYGVKIKKTEWQTLLYWFCPLYFLVDRIVIGPYWSGLLKFLILPILGFAFINRDGIIANLGLCIFGIEFLWIIIDGFTIKDRIRSQNLKRLNKLLFKNGIAKI